MAVVGVLVQAEVGDQDVVVTQLLAQGRKASLADALRVPRFGPFGILALRNAEQHEGEHAFRGDLAGLLAQGLKRVLEVTGHGRDRKWLRDPFLHEQGRDEMAGREVGLAD